MFKKINPYLKEELSQEAAAHICGCRCSSNANTVGDVISLAIVNNTCAAKCRIGNSDIKKTMLTEARRDRLWP